MVGARLPLRAGTYPLSFPAWVNNPLDIACPYEPVGIRIWFERGQCLDAAQIVVRDRKNVVLPHQWEPAEHTFFDVDMGTYPGGSLRYGTLWVMVRDLAPREARALTVTLHATSQGAAGAQAVTHTVNSATSETFAAAAATVTLTSGSAWMPNSYIDVATGGELLATSTGLTMRQKAGTAQGEALSSTAAEITGLAQSRRGSANFGYGVCYQEMEAGWTWVDQPTTTRFRARMWANGRVTMEAYTRATSAISSDSKTLIFNFSANNTGIVSTDSNNDLATKTWQYADRALVGGFRYLTTDYESKTSETHATNWSTSIAANRMFGGWIGTTSIPSGAYFFQGAFMDRTNADDADHVWLRGMNPLATTAAIWDCDEARAYIAGFVNRYINAWFPLNTDTDKKGLEGAMRILDSKQRGSSYSAASALALFEQYCSGAGVTSTSASSWHTRWAAGQGMNFIAKNASELGTIYEHAVARGETVVADTALTIMTAVADFVLQAEITSGGNGQMLLSGASEDNYNAEASAMRLLAQRLQISHRQDWAQCYERLYLRYWGGGFAGNTRRTYQYIAQGNLPHESIKLPQSTYDVYQNFELSRSLRMRSVSGFPEPDMRQYVYETINAAWQPDDRRYQAQVLRRGLSNTTMHNVFTLCRLGNPSDWAAAVLICRAAESQIRRGNGQVHPQYGYSGTDVSVLNVMGDIRSAAEMVTRGL